MRKMFFCAVLVCLWTSFSAQVFFDYYERNEITGDFSLKNIDDFEFAGKIRYESDLDDEKTGKVKGFYFNSEKIKFIDTIQSGKIEKIEYFDRETAKKIIEKTFVYDFDKMPKMISAWVKHEKYDIELNCFFTSSGGMIFCDGVQKKKFVYDADNECWINKDYVFKCAMDEKYRPLSREGKQIEWSTYYENNPLLTSKTLRCASDVSDVKEKWSYNKDGYSYDQYIGTSLNDCVVRKCYEINTDDERNITEIIVGKNMDVKGEVRLYKQTVDTVEKNYDGQIVEEEIFIIDKGNAKTIGLSDEIIRVVGENYVEELIINVDFLLPNVHQIVVSPFDYIAYR